MICAQCKKRNPIGYKFCGECGAKLATPESGLEAEEAERADRERRQERVGALLTQAFRLSEERKYSEALLLAEQAAEILPDSTSALALMASLYERLGQNDRAIATMEKVVERNPDSAADKAKLELMRKGIHLPPLPESERRKVAMADAAPLPWIPLIAAGGAMALVLGIGYSLMNRANTPNRAPRPVATPVTTIQPNPMSPSGPLPTAPSAIGGMTKQDLPPLTNARPDPFIGMAPPSVRQQRVASGNPSRPAPRRSGGGAASPMMLPRPGDIANGGNNTPANSGTVPPVTFPPVTFPPLSRTNTNPSGAVIGGDFGNGGRLSVSPPPNPTPPTNPGASETNTSNGGYIRIQVGGSAPKENSSGSGNGSGNSGRSGETPAPPSDETSMNRARRLQSSGRYADAIRAYQEALTTGMTGPDTAEVRQAIAQCFDRTGNENAARVAYHEAIQAYEAQISAGRNIGVARQGIVTCRAALEVLGMG